MRVFVAGGTGAVGGHAVPALVAAGHEVTALARTPAKAARLQTQGAEPVDVSLFDRRALERTIEGSDAVVNLTSAIPPVSRFMSPQAWEENIRVRRDGSHVLVDAALGAGVIRLIQESVVMLYADRGGEWIDEDAATSRYPMAEANHAAEANATRFTEAGQTGVVLRFGWFYGPGARHSEQFFALARRGICVQMGRPDTYVSSIHVRDAASAVAAALAAPAGVYNVVDDEPLTKQAYADALAAAAGRRPWLRYPGRLAQLLGDKSTSLTRSIRASNERFKAATGWRPAYPDARRGWEATAAELARASS